MAHKKKENIRKLTRMGSGRSIGLTLPAEILRELHWRERQKVVVKRVGKKMVVEDWPIQPVRQTHGKQAQGKKKK